MTNSTIQAIFSDTTIGIVKTVIASAVPDAFDWIPNTILNIVAIVDDIDRIDEASGADKFDAVVVLVTETLDDMDDIPGWSSLSETGRDRFIGAIVEMVVFVMRAVQAKGLPAIGYQESFAGALNDMTLAIFEMVGAFDRSTVVETETASVAAVGAQVRQEAAPMIATVVKSLQS